MDGAKFARKAKMPTLVRQAAPIVHSEVFVVIELEHRTLFALVFVVHGSMPSMDSVTFVPPAKLAISVISAVNTVEMDLFGACWTTEHSYQTVLKRVATVLVKRHGDMHNMDGARLARQAKLPTP
jgi:hypothetical protein